MTGLTGSKKKKEELVAKYHINTKGFKVVIEGFKQNISSSF